MPTAPKPGHALGDPLPSSSHKTTKAKTDHTPVSVPTENYKTSSKSNYSSDLLSQAWLDPDQFSGSGLRDNGEQSSESGEEIVNSASGETDRSYGTSKVDNHLLATSSASGRKSSIPTPSHYEAENYEKEDDTGDVADRSRIEEDDGINYLPIGEKDDNSNFESGQPEEDNASNDNISGNFYHQGQMHYRPSSDEAISDLESAYDPIPQEEDPAEFIGRNQEHDGVDVSPGDHISTTKSSIRRWKGSPKIEFNPFSAEKTYTVPTLSNSMSAAKSSKLVIIHSPTAESLRDDNKNTIYIPSKKHTNPTKGQTAKPVSNTRKVDEPGISKGNVKFADNPTLVRKTAEDPRVHNTHISYSYSVSEKQNRAEISPTNKKGATFLETAYQMISNNSKKIGTNRPTKSMIDFHRKNGSKKLKIKHNSELAEPESLRLSDSFHLRRSKDPGHKILITRKENLDLSHVARGKKEKISEVPDDLHITKTHFVPIKGSNAVNMEAETVSVSRKENITANTVSKSKKTGKGYSRNDTNIVLAPKQVTDQKLIQSYKRQNDVDHLVLKTLSKSFNSYDSGLSKPQDNITYDKQLYHSNSTNRVRSKGTMNNGPDSISLLANLTEKVNQGDQTKDHISVAPESNVKGKDVINFLAKTFDKKKFVSFNQKPDKKTDIVMNKLQLQKTYNKASAKSAILHESSKIAPVELKYLNANVLVKRTQNVATGKTNNNAEKESYLTDLLNHNTIPKRMRGFRRRTPYPLFANYEEEAQEGDEGFPLCKYDKNFITLHFI